jgi:small subunit ribosomal protein S8
MSVSDPIADMLTRIRNAIMIGRDSVIVPSSKIKLDILQILKEEGFLSDFRISEDKDNEESISVDLHYWSRGDAAISGLKRISKPGLRAYVGKDDIPYVQGGRGVVVLSTNQGVMTGIKAKNAGVGGEVLFHVW